MSASQLSREAEPSLAQLSSSKSEPQQQRATWPPCQIPMDVSAPSDFVSNFDEWMRAQRARAPARARTVCPRWEQRVRDLMKSPQVKAEHEAYLRELGVEEDLEEALPPVIPGTDCFNPVLEKFWLPLARYVLFAGYSRLEYTELPDSTAVLLVNARVRDTICWSVPTLSVLRYMIESAPEGRILDVGAGTGYWSALLAGLGADVVAVDDFSWWQDRPEFMARWGEAIRGKPAPPGAESSGSRNGTPGGDGAETAGADAGGSEAGGEHDGSSQMRPFYFDVRSEDAANYIESGKAGDRALLFSWPAGVMHSVECYTGETIFFIGEDPDGATDHMQNHESFRETWTAVHRSGMPCWLFKHDEFVVYKRTSSLS
ncbi:hypothetical protein KFL_004060100 [Klebsormidium nitens]|uniref:Uncharacterized protein n=1 Tax=Klebsormidium nitens TaxID=105231 RepID=A0A1Y1IB35_KLENI|nr:hypothetical protein KFL_004060100 [Klebsormidium nitens]|eukprot:GAQ88175.1 hypothetical protein KFL_004060100 [Klebsormidium nitens]